MATGKSRQGLERAFETTQTRGFFTTSRCADESVPKPGPEMVLEICATLDLDPALALVVGDTTHDIGMAHSAGAQALAVTYGAHEKESLMRLAPVDCLDTVVDLHQWVRTHILHHA
ncbi:MAG: HAD-IA family hydrolase [Burkholderiaceae bacterium]